MGKGKKDVCKWKANTSLPMGNGEEFRHLGNLLKGLGKLLLKKRRDKKKRVIQEKARLESVEKIKKG